MRVEHYTIIEKKVSLFIKRFYTNELIKGALLLLAFGGFYFLLTLLIEYLLWLRPTGRTILFWLLIIVEVGLFIKFIGVPLARLLKLAKGINQKTAARLIGDHFPEVKDKLVNTLELYEEGGDSELVLASIEQRSSALEPIPFQLAVDFKKNTNYLAYILLPLVLFLGANLLIDEPFFKNSYQRVINYNANYAPPAPFAISITNSELIALEGKDYILEVETVGKVVPEELRLILGDESYVMQKQASGQFTYTFEQVAEEKSFRLEAGIVSSQNYTLQLISVPSVLTFEMDLNYPTYVKKRDETILNSGNATVPEGTIINWKINTKATQTIEYIEKDTSFNFAISEKSTDSDAFQFTKRVKSKTDYFLSISNSKLIDYERLSYTIEVVKDQYPTIEVASKEDSVNGRQVYVNGILTDDYGLRSLSMVYGKVNTDDKKRTSLAIAQNTFDEFVYAFPNTLPLEEGANYEFYFEVVDNDAVNGGKKSKSQIFTYYQSTQSEEENRQLERQGLSLEKFENVLNSMTQSKEELDALSQKQKENAALSFNEQKQLTDFLERQKSQEKMMKDFSQEMKENLEDFQKELSDVEKDRLKERLERQEEQAKKNEQLLKEIEELRDKMSKEELSEKLEKLSKQNKNSKRNLEQMLELTKRYYVQKKVEKIAQDLEQLGKEQLKLSAKEKENTKEAQEELNASFKEIEKDLEAIEKENEKLKRPLEVPSDKEKQEEIGDAQKEATENLEKSQEKNQGKEGAQKKQKEAGEKMQQMSAKMQSSMQQSGQEGMEEDVETLRQILDNLLVFSFEEESLMERFEAMSDNSPSYAQNIRRQNEIQRNFRHIDDSLFALSLRRAELEEMINESITDIDYNLNKSLERFAENRMNQGASSQRYVIAGSNKLADFLSDALNNLQNQLAASGEGQGNGQGQGQGQGSSQGQGGQLQDIIQSQEELQQALEEMGKKEGSGRNEEGGQMGGAAKEGAGNDGQKNGDGENGSTEKGISNGSDTNKDQGEGDLENEALNQILYDIFQRQQSLRLALDRESEKLGIGAASQSILDTMERLEQELLNRGFSENSARQMESLKHQLMQLEEAVIKQGEESKRESSTSIKTFQNSERSLQLKARSYFPEKEVLNRNRLPLNGKHKERVTKYFKEDND